MRRHLSLILAVILLSACFGCFWEHEGGGYGDRGGGGYGEHERGGSGDQDRGEHQERH